jgi:monoamine oxidase
MSRLSRRSFLTASAALIAAPALRIEPATAADVDVAVVGAGAAGIAAARRIIAAGRSVHLIEASKRVGGRCVTDTGTFGVPFDLGAHWMHNPAANPLARLAPKGLDIYRAPRGLSMRVGSREARDSELENFLAGLVRARSALTEAGRGRADRPAANTLPRDLGAARAAIEFVAGPLACGKDLSDVSAIDLGRAAERDDDAFCRQGYGALLAKLAAGLPVQFANPVDAIAWKRGPEVSSRRGSLSARAVILTVSTNVLASGHIEFFPALPQRLRSAAEKLSLGSYDHIALDMPGNPLGLLKDDFVFEEAQGKRTAALLANVSGTSLHLVEVAGSFGRGLSAQGEGAMIEFAREWLGSIFGVSVKGKIKRARATRWDHEPFVLGAMSAAAIGGTPARRTLMEPLEDRVWLAGEAVHETRWGTVEGAWESGERAADAVLRHFGALKQDGAKKKPVRGSRKPRRRRHRRER